MIARIAVLTAIAAPGAAQLGAPLPNPGFPSRSHKLEVGQLLGRDGILGVARTADGHYWVTARRSPRLPATNPHVLIEIDVANNRRQVYPVPRSELSLWGLRDLAYDGSRYLYGGWEGDSVLAFDTVNRTWDPSADFVVPIGRKLDFPRALAYDPQGDGGRGSLWTANWNSEHVEFDRRGSILRRRANLQRDTFGAAYDPVRRTIWWFGQDGSNRAPPNAVVATEMDLVTLAPTGQQVFGDTATINGIVPGGFAGGAEFYESAGRTVLLLTSQADDDVVYELWGRFSYGPTTGGSIGFDGGAAFVGNPAFGVSTSGTPEPFAVLAIGFGEASVPLFPPTFVSGSRLLLDAGIGLCLEPPRSVVGGVARNPLPIPNDPSLAGVDLYFQWVEFSTNGGAPAPPLRLSDGGKIQILP